MRTFEEYLNQPSGDLVDSWKRVEAAWDQYLYALNNHVQNNRHKYDTYHAKFGGLSNEHPEEQFSRLIRPIEKHFKRMRQGIKKVSAHDMI